MNDDCVNVGLVAHLQSIGKCIYIYTRVAILLISDPLHLMFVYINTYPRLLLLTKTKCIKKIINCNKAKIKQYIKGLS